MATFESFKSFIQDKPFLKEKVKRGDTTWQELYEHYDLYGEQDELFKHVEPHKEEEKKEEESPKEEKKDDSVSSFINMISGIDVDKISDGLNGMKKILNILSEVTTGEDVTPFSARRNQKPYKRDDD